MTHSIRFDHVGITVSDLDAAVDFFFALGFEIEGRTIVDGEFIDTVTGIPGSCSEIVMMRLPGGGTAVEVSSFVRPEPVVGSPAPMANELGIRSVAFDVDDLDGRIRQLGAAGYQLIGGVGEYEHTWRMAYVRGPDGIIVALAELMGDTPE